MQMNSLERRRESRSGSPVSEGYPMGSKSTTSPNSKRSTPYGMVLLLATLFVALLLLLAHRQREKGLVGLLLEKHELEAKSLHAQLQKEKEISEEMKKKIGELTLFAGSLKSQKIELRDKLVQSQNEAGQLKQRNIEMEFEQASSQTEISALKEVELQFTKAKKEIKSLQKDLKRKSRIIESMTIDLGLLPSRGGNASIGTNMNGFTLPRNAVEHPQDQNTTVVGGNVQMNETPFIMASKREQQKNATIVDHANDTLSNDVVEHGGAPHNGRELDKTMVNKTLVFKGNEKHEGGGGLIEVDSDLENKEQLGNQTNGEGGKNGVAEEDLLTNKTDGWEPQNYTSIKTKFSGASHGGERLEVANVGKDHAIPVKPKKKAPRVRLYGREVSKDAAASTMGIQDFRRVEVKNKETLGYDAVNHGIPLVTEAYDNGRHENKRRIHE